jgi:hypothetical protein
MQAREKSGNMTESFSEMFEQTLANQRIRAGMILTGRVISVGDDMVVVSVGLKSEAVIPLDQFRNEKGEIEVVAGDEVEVALDAGGRPPPGPRCRSSRCTGRTPWASSRPWCSCGDLPVGTNGLTLPCSGAEGQRFASQYAR